MGEQIIRGARAQVHMMAEPPSELAKETAFSRATTGLSRQLAYSTRRESRIQVKSMPGGAG